MSELRNKSKTPSSSSVEQDGLILCGDNVGGMQHLLNMFSKSSKVDIIEIDPPYNVGGTQGYKNVWNGQSKKYGVLGETHGEFLHFMDSRLRLAKDLLADDGIIFIHLWCPCYERA